jgi:hypothetical protein
MFFDPAIFKQTQQTTKASCPQRRANIGKEDSAANKGLSAALLRKRIRILLDAIH